MKYIEINNKYLQGTPLASGSHNQIIFVRPEVFRLFSSLREVASDDSVGCTISGPPGIGKSLSTYVFMCTLLDTHVITWVNDNTLRWPTYVQFDKGSKISGTLEGHTSLLALLRKPELGARRHVVILDGYRDSSLELGKTCGTWVYENLQLHRYVVVTSMGGFKVDVRLGDSLHWIKFSLRSWTKQDHLEAVKCDSFFEYVKDKLDANIVPNSKIQDFTPTPAELVKSKFYFAGGSSRYMFDLSTEKVIADIHENVERCENLSKHVSGTIGGSSSQAVNSLLASYGRGSSHVSSVPVSEYAASVLAERLGPSYVLNLRNSMVGCMTPVFDGILFHMWFFAKLKSSGLVFFERGFNFGFYTNWIRRRWPESEFVNFNPEKSIPFFMLSEGGVWLKPSKWNQGGYDAVYLVPAKKSITFVQITKADTHSFKTEHFNQLLVTIEAIWKIDITHLEICFLVPSDRAQTFKVQSPSEPGLFAKYFVLGRKGVKWERTKELEHVKICSVDIK
jgi:hypothetical protein